MFPLHSPKIERIEVAARGDVRRAKLYYLRDRVGKRARVRERRYTGPEETVEGGLLHEPGEAVDAEGVTAEETVAEAAEAAQAQAQAQAEAVEAQAEQATEVAEAATEDTPQAQAEQDAEGGSEQAAADEAGSSSEAGEASAGDATA